jgi:hypothetical protein
MGVPLQILRLVRFDGPAGCTHHLLARAGRPSYPNYDQSAEDAAESLVGSSLAILTGWCARWWLPWQCRADGHRSVMVGETDDSEGIIYTEAPSEIDLAADVGMRTLDIWVARGSGHRIALGHAPDAATFWAAVDAEPPDDADDLVRPGAGLHVLFLTDRSGEGDLRDV